MMTLQANSYGVVSEIAALVPRYTKGGAFDASTRPTKTQVESWCDQVSAIVNNILSDNGFTIPITQTDCKLMLDFFINEEVASICEGVNGHGRFGPQPRRGSGGSGRFSIILTDVEDFLNRNMAGFERLGAGRTYDYGSSIGYRATDEAGDETFPLFERKGFGNRFIEWDSD
jgi:hypothetical protein